MPVNDYSYDNEQDLLIPDHQNTNDPYDTNRPNNKYGHQTADTDLNSKVDTQTLLINTDGNTPIVDSLDILEDTSTLMYAPAFTPSILPIDAGSGKIVINDDENNNDKLKKFMSIE
jgi:hypothetical protein